MHDRHAALDGGEVGDGAQVHALLRAVGAQHRKAGLAAGVNVGMVAEDAQRLCGERARRDVHHGRQKFARDFVHVRDHQQQALRGGVGRGQGACREGAVHGAGSAALRLHFGDANGSAEQVFPARSGHLVRFVRHDGRRRDGIDGGHIGERIRGVCGRRVAVHGLHFS